MQTRTYVLAFQTLLLFIFSNLSYAANYYDNGTNANYHLYDGDTLFIISGNYTGSIITFEPGAVIKVNTGTSFKPIDIRNPHGKIINSGHILITFPFLPLTNFKIENFSTISINNTIKTDGHQSWFNSFGAKMDLKGNVDLNPGLSFKNNGEISFGGNLTVNDNTVFENFNIVEAKGDIFFNGGANINKGQITSKSKIYFNVGEQNINQCRLISENGIDNNHTLINDGFILITGNGTNRKFTNAGHGMLLLKPNSIIKTDDFTNYSSIQGSGEIYTTGSTVNTGNVGFASSSDSIFVFDATRSNPSRIFDYDWGTVHPNARFKSLPEPDNDFIPLGCSDLYTAVPLPVKWKWVHIKHSNDLITLSWKASFSEGYYIVEQSTDHRKFIPVAMLPFSAGEQYEVNFDNYEKGGTLHYRIKHVSLDGKETFSQIKTLKTNEVIKKNALIAYPNPVIQELNLDIFHDKNEQLWIDIVHFNGSSIVSKLVNCQNGYNKIILNETHSLPHGIYTIAIKRGAALLHTHKFIKL